MLSDYLVIGGVEIINAARARAYTRTVDDCGNVAASCFDCPDGTELWLNDGKPYEGIVEDPAPWYDEAIPESKDFTGVYGLEITGASTGAYPDPGGDSSSPSGAIREIQLTIGMSAATECAMSYGIGWLTNALGRPTCSESGCVGQQACMLACCPVITDPETGEASNDPIRTLFDVVTVEGPEITERGEGPTQVYATAEFTLRTTNIGVFRNATDATTLEVRPANGELTNLDLKAVYEACEEPPDCSVDPDCRPPDLGQLPEPPVDPCYPSDPFQAYRTLATIDSKDMSSTFDMVPVITVVTQNRALRNLVVRLYNNPFGADCSRIPELNPCRACADVILTYVPPDARAVIDGRTGRSIVECRSDQGLATHVPTVFGPRGTLGNLPVIQCGSGLCVEVYAADSVGPDAMVTVEFVVRQVAA